MRAHRTLAIALINTLLLPVMAATHPLPPTTLTFSGGAGSLGIEIAMPLPELLLALPDRTIFAEPLPQGPLDPKIAGQIANYLSTHMALSAADQSTLPLHLTKTSVTSATHEDIGAYDLITIQLSAPLVANLFPIALHYDAIMHQVRNHSAIVQVQSDSQPPQILGTIRPDPDLGQPQPFVLKSMP